MRFGKYTVGKLLTSTYLSNIVEETNIRGVKRASKHEILPQHDPKLVGSLVEALVFINPASPYPQHVHMGVCC